MWKAGNFLIRQRFNFYTKVQVIENYIEPVDRIVRFVFCFFSEIHFTGSEIVVHTEEKAISLTNLKVSSSKAGDSRERTRKYGFDYCFDSSDPRAEKYASQSKIYETLGESILDVLFKGFNSCLVAYGQSASGKTYTMMGSKVTMIKYDNYYSKFYKYSSFLLVPQKLLQQIDDDIFWSLFYMKLCGQVS